MPSDYTYSNKIAVLDLIITMLREQEKVLNELAGRLSEALGVLPKKLGVRVIFPSFNRAKGVDLL